VASSVAGSKSGFFFFSVRHQKKHFLEVSVRTIEYLVEGYHVSVTTYLRASEEIPRVAVPPAFKWREDASKTYCNHEVPIVSSFNVMRHLMVTRISKTKRLRAYVL
jgi:UDP-N-acetylglucosamine pyrophosphorylase